MNEVNRVLLAGRLGQNPDLKYTKKGEAICIFSIAENVAGIDQPRWHKVVSWGKLAEASSVHLRQGNLVFVQGRKLTREYQNTSGEIRKTEEFKADLIGFSLT
jgi:single-strand DNA-binding protein